MPSSIFAIRRCNSVGFFATITTAPRPSSGIKASNSQRRRRFELRGLGDADMKKMIGNRSVRCPFPFASNFVKAIRAELEFVAEASQDRRLFTELLVVEFAGFEIRALALRAVVNEEIFAVL